MPTEQPYTFFWFTNGIGYLCSKYLRYCERAQRCSHWQVWIYTTYCGNIPSCAKELYILSETWHWWRGSGGAVVVVWWRTTAHHGLIFQMGNYIFMRVWITCHKFLSLQWDWELNDRQVFFPLLFEKLLLPFLCTVVPNNVTSSLYK